MLNSKIITSLLGNNLGTVNFYKINHFSSFSSNTIVIWSTFWYLLTNFDVCDLDKHFPSNKVHLDITTTSRNSIAINERGKKFGVAQSYGSQRYTSVNNKQFVIIWFYNIEMVTITVTHWYRKNPSLIKALLINIFTHVQFFS